MPGSDALAAALLTLEGLAAERDDGAVLHTRVADFAGARYLDLGTEDGAVVRFSGGRWSVMNPPLGLYFRRSQLLAPFPEPQRGGHVEDLFGFLNVQDEDRAVLLADLAHTFHENEPHVVTYLEGEQGTGKSSAAKMLVALTDPSPAARVSSCLSIQYDSAGS